MMNNKISITKQFIRENIDPNISEMKLDLVELLMNQQFSAFKLVIEKGYSKEGDNRIHKNARRIYCGGLGKGI